MTDVAGSAVKRVDAETMGLIVDALVEGLRVNSAKLNWRCGRALCALGKPLIPYLMDVIEDERTPAAHRRQLRRLTSEISCARPVDGKRGVLITEALLEAIRVSDPELNAKAIEAIRHFPTVVDRLIVEAACNRKAPDYCAKLLHAAGESRQRPNVDQHFDLFALAADKNPRIQAQAAQLIAQIQMLPVQRVSHPAWPGK
jgi:hypothetical protein